MNFLKIILIIQLFLSFSYGYTKEEVEEWRKIGIYEASIKNWETLGFNFEKAKKWCTVYSECIIVRVKKWHKLGIYSAKEMKQWMDVVSPQWRNISSSSFVISKVTAWKSFGVNNPYIAKEWCKIMPGYEYGVRYHLEKLKEYGLTDLKIAKIWYSKGIIPNEAIYWIEKGVTNPTEASQWSKINIGFNDVKGYKEIGLNPQGAIGWQKRKFGSYEIIKWLNIGINNSKVAASWRYRGFKPEEAVIYKKYGVDNPEEASRWYKVVNGNPESISVYKKYGLSSIEQAERWKNLFTFIYNNFDKKYVKKIMKVVWNKCDKFNGDKSCLLLEGFKNNFKSINDKLWISSGSKDILIKFDGGFFSSDVPEDYLIEDNGYNKIYMIVYKSGSDTVINRFTNTKRKIGVYSPVFHQLQLK